MMLLVLMGDAGKKWKFWAIQSFKLYTEDEERLTLESTPAVYRSPVPLICVFFFFFGLQQELTEYWRDPRQTWGDERMQSWDLNQ